MNVRRLETGGRICSLIKKAEDKRVSKRKIITFLKKKGVSEQHIIKGYAKYYKQQGLYEITFNERPLGFTMKYIEENEKYAYVSSIQDDVLIELGLTTKSSVYEVDGNRMDGQSYKEIVRQISTHSTPFYIVFKRNVKLEWAHIPQTTSIDHLTKHIVLCFIHDSQQSISIGDIPDLVFYLCVTYLFDQEQWDVSSKGGTSIIDDDGTVSTTSGTGKSLYLTKIVETFGVHHWRFKVQKIEKERECCIGIWDTTSNNGIPITRSIFTEKSMNGYSFDIANGNVNHANGMTKKHGLIACDGDMVDMIVDLNANELKYYINGTDYGTAFQLKREGTYRVAIGLKSGSAVQFIGYYNHHNKIEISPIPNANHKQHASQPPMLPMNYNQTHMSSYEHANVQNPSNQSENNDGECLVM